MPSFFAPNFFGNQGSVNSLLYASGAMSPPDTWKRSAAQMSGDANGEAVRAREREKYCIIDAGNEIENGKVHLLFKRAS